MPSSPARVSALLCLFSTSICQAAVNPITFDAQTIDSAMAGDVKAAGDLDGDGYPDLVVGGMKGSENMKWWRFNPQASTWFRYALATPLVEFSTDMQLADMDRDGDLDVVVPDGAEEIVWLENPRPSRTPQSVTSWTRRRIGDYGDVFVHDLEVADLDRDGKIDVIARRDGAKVYFQNSSTSFTAVTLPISGSEGIGQGDIDGDGDIDLIADGAWFENPYSAQSPRSPAWIKHGIATPWNTSLTATTADLNGDGKLDVIFAAQHVGAKFAWYQGPANPRTATSWPERVIASSGIGSHKLNTADFDGNGKPDLQTALENVDVNVFLNDGASTPAFTKQKLQDAGHNVRVVDIGNDGVPDLFGARGYTGQPPVRAWINKTPGCSVSRAVPKTGGTGSGVLALAVLGLGMRVVSVRLKQNGTPARDLA